MSDPLDEPESSPPKQDSQNPLESRRRGSPKAGAGKNGERRGGPRKPSGFLLVSLVLSTLVMAALLFDGNSTGRNVLTSFDAVVALLRQDRLESPLELVELEHKWRGTIRRPQGEPGPKKFEVAYGELGASKFHDELRRYNQERSGGEPSRMVDYRTVKSSAAAWGAVFGLLPWVVFAFIIYWFFIRGFRAGGPGGNVLTFGRSRARLATKESTGVTFSDVAGIEEAKGEVKEIIEFLKNPGRFQRLGGRLPRGVMLVGSPGTGKTLLAKAIAGEAEVPFFSICGSDFVEMFVGVGAARVRDLFRQARENSPCIIYLDEVDAVGRKRGTGIAGGHDEREQTLNAILVEMDGFNTDENIIVLASTNRPDVLDPALLRPGRFDREIVLDLPDVKGREEILKVHTRKVKLDVGVNLHRIARATPTFSGAELAALVNEAAILAAMTNQESIKETDLEEARDKIRWGRQKQSRVMDDADRRITAYHEAGHAIAMRLFPHAEPLHKVTIIPRGMALGATMQLPEKDRYHYTRKHLLDQISVLYAGRIAEELACSDITAGAKNDIERATELARTMVTEWGMSEKLGPINYAAPAENPFMAAEPGRSWPNSASISERIDEEVRRIVDECYQRCEKALKKHREDLERVAKGLMERETLTADEVATLMEGRELPPPAPVTTPAAA